MSSDGDSHPPGTIVTLHRLESRPDLNGKTALLTSKVLDSGRHEAFVLLTNASESRPEGINVFEKNFTINTVERQGRASAWNELGCRFMHTGNYTNGLDAFECALEIASTNTSECRIEGCDALCLMVWLGLRMNSEGIEFKGERTAAQIVKFGLRNIFAEVLENKNVVTETAKVDMGAGRIPSRDSPVLLLSIVEETSERYFFYDEMQKVVNECTMKKMTNKGNNEDANNAISTEDAENLPETSSNGQTNVSGEE
tara:strand:+ start:17745 stop:18509 length:765 start_codon:yes stop_codon:yes gene_type:complete